jgi:hypothetical protein
MSPPIATLARPSRDEDFHAWALDQAARLRDLAERRPNEPIDWNLLAEEIELVAGGERRACQAFLEHVIAHLLKIEYARDPEPIRRWRVEVRAFRRNLARALTGTIENQLRAALPEHYAAAVEDAEAAMRDDPTFLGRTPRTCPYSFEQVTGSWLPERAEP